MSQMRINKLSKKQQSRRIALGTEASRDVVKDTVSLREGNFNYFIDVHDGRRSWMNLVNIKVGDLRHMYADKKHQRRCEAYFFLSYSLGGLEAMPSGAQYVCSVCQLIAEFVYCLSQQTPQRVKEVKFRARTVVNVDTFQPEVKFIGSFPDYEHLLTPKINTALDYREVLLVLCEVAARMYAKVKDCMKIIPDSVYQHIMTFDSLILTSIIDPMVRDIEEVASSMIKRVYKAIRPSKMGTYSGDDTDDGDDDDGDMGAPLWGTADELEINTEDDLAMDDAAYNLDEEGDADYDANTEAIMRQIETMDRNALTSLAEQKAQEIEEFEQMKEELSELSKMIGRVHMHFEAQAKVAEVYAGQLEKAKQLETVASTADQRGRELINQNQVRLIERAQESTVRKQEAEEDLQDLTQRIGDLQEMIKQQQLSIGLATQTRSLIEDMLLAEIEMEGESELPSGSISLSSLSYDE